MKRPFSGFAVYKQIHTEYAPAFGEKFGNV